MLAFGGPRSVPGCHSLQASLPDTDVRTVNLSTKRKAAKGRESGKAEQKRQVIECGGTGLPAVWPARGQEALATQREQDISGPRTHVVDPIKHAC